MKVLKKIKLNAIAENNLANREMNTLKGGVTVCTCSCCYAGSRGGSSSTDNANANAQYSYYSPCGDNGYTGVYNG